MNGVLFLILNDLSKLDDVQDIFYRNSCGATTVDSTGLGRTLLEHGVDMPLLSSLRTLIERDKPYNKTIFSMMHNDEQLQTVISEIRDVLQMDTVNKQGAGFLFVVPVLEWHGFDLTACGLDDD